MDIAAKIGIGLAVGLGTAGVIINPNKNQKEAAALYLFEKPFEQLPHIDKVTSEFYAGHTRWKNFFEKSVYPITRRLPGAQNPIVNPYKDLQPAQQEED